MSLKIFDDEIIESVRGKLIRNRQTLAVAESVTSGMLQLAFSQADEASGFFQGGITAYNLGQKARHLYIDPIQAQAVNCVSEQIAAELALQVTRMFSSHWGLGITGYATPVPESGNELFAHYAIVFNKNVVLTGEMRPTAGKALEVQLFYVNYLLSAFNNVVDFAR
ncbi:CinA family protein [Chitinophaga sp. XS-30]|uniref:CinA family protein n=1 Tax=Chitinophaga sp. XS-30 TaxID=2604421 RepID=UPI0011DD3793|nr:CinA family protein [Chitinophaga sp. XS-30]QEH39545.1 damage-inducible protein CinA [Chitinophaga sp. XS-30]